MLKIDQIAYQNRLAGANPYIKCSFGIGMLLLVVSLPNVILDLSVILVMLSLLFYARVPFGFLLKLLSLPLGFLSMSVLMILLTYSKDPTYLIGKLGLFGGYIGYTEESLKLATYLFFRCLASIHCIYFITLTVGMNQFIKVFKKLHIPHEIIELMILMYRFIFILIEEIDAMKLAQEMRFGYGNLKTSYHATALLISSLWRRVMRRYEALCVVLEMKLYNGTFY